eukprot:5948930-Amphidinium_carterae.1
MPSADREEALHPNSAVTLPPQKKHTALSSHLSDKCPRGHSKLHNFGVGWGTFVLHFTLQHSACYDVTCEQVKEEEYKIPDWVSCLIKTRGDLLEARGIIARSQGAGAALSVRRVLPIPKSSLAASKAEHDRVHDLPTPPERQK